MRIPLTVAQRCLISTHSSGLPEKAVFVLALVGAGRHLKKIVRNSLLIE